MKAALIQLNCTDQPATNLSELEVFFESAIARGADFVLTPEVTNCISTSRTHQEQTLSTQKDDPTLAAICQMARRARVWVLIGSLALKTDDADGRFANRSFLIGPDGQIVATYDKIHMFDVTVSETEAYRESNGYRPGAQAVLAEAEFAKIGMTICYDIRFPALYQSLAQAGAEILTVPSAFSPVTGAAHWETLLRARAVETGCFVLAPAQTGTHAATIGKSRTTYGHSLVINPWGDILADGGTEPGVICVDLDLAEVETARMRIPAWKGTRDYEGPA